MISVSCIQVTAEIYGQTHIFFVPHGLEISDVTSKLKQIADTAHVANTKLVEIDKKDYINQLLPGL